MEPKFLSPTASYRASPPPPKVSTPDLPADQALKQELTWNPGPIWASFGRSSGFRSIVYTCPPELVNIPHPNNAIPTFNPRTLPNGRPFSQCFNMPTQPDKQPRVMWGSNRADIIYDARNPEPSQEQLAAMLSAEKVSDVAVPVAAPVAASTVMPTLPDYCGSLGKPSADGSLRIYTQEECEQKLNGLFHQNGQCSKKDGRGSYSWDCRPLQPTRTEPTIQKIESMPRLDLRTPPVDMGGIAKLLQPITDAQAAMQKTITATQELLKEVAGQITQLLRISQPVEKAVKFPNNAEAENTENAENLAAAGGGKTRRKSASRMKKRMKSFRNRRP